jgi:hypothetical protein
MSSPAKVVTGKVRLSYAFVMKPRPLDNKYSLSVLIPKSDTATVAKIKEAIEKATQAGKESKWGGSVPKGLRSPLRDGDAERDDEAYKGHYFVNCTSKDKPTVVDAQLNEILNPTELYSGCYGRVSIVFFPYNFEGTSKGIGAGLQNVQKLEDGPSLMGRATAAEEFTAETEDFLA